VILDLKVLDSHNKSPSFNVFNKDYITGFIVRGVLLCPLLGKKTTSFSVTFFKTGKDMEFMGVIFRFVLLKNEPYTVG